MEPILEIARALSEEKRLRILMALQGRELCTCELSRLLDLTDSTVSTHMAILKRAGLVESRKSGRWVYYSIPTDPEPAVKEAIRWITTILKDSRQAREDADKLKGVLRCQSD